MNEKKEILANTIVFEGLDGAGTTTQTELLADTLKELGQSVLQTCEPTDSIIGKLIRRALRGEFSITPKALAFLFAADREDHIRNHKTGMQVFADAGGIVITDRYFFSSLAYQSIDTPYEEIALINQNFPYPQIIVYLDTPPKVCMSRLSNRTSHDQFEQLDFQEKVYLMYERAFDALPENCRLIRFDGTQEINALSRRIFEQVSQIISIASPYEKNL